MVSLEYLLDHGFLRERAVGDAFDLNDKAVLALSLARCLIHLWQGSWMQEPWTAKSIHFLSRTDEILDIHHPYVSCTLREYPQAKPTPAEFQSTLLSFARLLAEIETGAKIDADPGLLSSEQFYDAVEDAMKAKRDEWGRRDYNNAVDACFQFKALCMKELRDSDSHENAARDSLGLARKVLYMAVVEHLEANFDQIPNPTKALMPRALKLTRHTTGSALATPVAQPGLARNFRPPRAYKASQAVPAHTVNLDAEASDPKISGTMFFDGEATEIEDKYVIHPHYSPRRRTMPC